MADMGWSDCGRTSKAQTFYGKKLGRKHVGRCGRDETRRALYAQRLERTWKRLFEMKHDRPPSDEEMWAALKTGEIAENVYAWERQPLREEKNPPKKPHIHRGSGGRRMADILADSVRESAARREEAALREMIKAEAERIKHEERVRIFTIQRSSEVTKRVLYQIRAGKSKIQDVCTVFGVDAERIDELMEAFGLK